MSDQVEIGGLLHVLGKELEEAGVVDGVVVVVARVNVQGVLRHRAGRNVEDVRQPLPDRGVEGLVHVGDALTAREVRRAESRHAHSCGYRGGSVLPFRLEEDEPSAVDVQLPFRVGDGPAFAHLSRWRDRVGAGSFTGGGLHLDDGGRSVESLRLAGVFRLELVLSLLFLYRAGLHAVTLLPSVWFCSLMVAGIFRLIGNCIPSTQTIAFVGQRAMAEGSASSYFS